MKKMQTLTVNGNAYQISDPEAVSFAEDQALTGQQKLQARQNLGIPEEKTYELIEDVTLTEEATSFYRNTDPSGKAYDFSAVRIIMFAPAYANATSSAQVIFNLSSFKTTSKIYHQASGAIATSAKRTYLVARNDHGRIDYCGVVASGTDMSTLSARPWYLVLEPWENISNISITTNLSDLVIPAGTRIVIYAIRG